MSLDKELLHNKIRLVALLVFVFSLPFSKVANNLAVILLMVNWLFESSFSVKWDRVINKPLLVCFWSTYVVSIIGLVYTDNMPHGLFELEKRITFLLFPIMFSTSSPISKDEIRLVFKAFILACSVASIVCFVYAFHRNYEEGHTFSYIFNAIFFDEHLSGRYYYFNYYYFTYYFFTEPLNIHPIYFAMYMLFSSSLIIWLWWDKTNFKESIGLWKICLLVCNVVVIVLLSSRTQMFSLLLIGTIFILYYSYSKKQLLTGISFILFLYIISITLILLNPISRERFTQAINPSVHYSENKHGEGGLSLRLYKWKYAIIAIENSPLFGTGTGDAQDVLQKVYMEHDFQIGYENELNPHNQYLQSTLELGLLGLSALLLSLVVPFYYAYKKHVWIYLIFILILSIGFLTESILELNKGIVFYSFFNSLLAFNFLKD